MVDFLLYAASFDASVATRSKISVDRDQISLGLRSKGPLPLTKEFKMDMARFEIPVSGWTCFNTKTRVNDVRAVDENSKTPLTQPQNCRCDGAIEQRQSKVGKRDIHTFVDVGRVCLLSCLVALLLVAGGRRGLFAGLFLLSRCFSASRSLSAS